MVKSIAAGLVLGILVFPVDAAEWCGKGDRENFAEFAQTYWAGSRSPSGRAIIYTLGAPWCPYCAQLFKSSRSNKHSFEIRFIPIQAMNERHRDQIADIAIGGSDAALTRAYVTRNEPIPPIDQARKAFVLEVQEVTNQALFDRFSTMVNSWGTPMSFVLKDDTIAIVKGMLNLDGVERFGLQKGGAETTPATLRFLKTGLPAALPMTGTIRAAKDNVRLRVLPDETALTHLCLRKGTQVPAVERLVVDGVEWFAMRQNPPKSDRVYGLARDFVR